MKPTGIAIFEAQKRGFPSVAHLVQVQYLIAARVVLLHDMLSLCSPAEIGNLQFSFCLLHVREWTLIRDWVIVMVTYKHTQRTGWIPQYCKECPDNL